MVDAAWSGGTYVCAKYVKAFLSPPCMRFFVILRELPVAAPAVAEPIVDVIPPEPEEPEAANGFPQTSAYMQSLHATYISTTKFCPSGLPEVYGVVSRQFSGFTAGVAIPVLVMWFAGGVVGP